MLYLIDDLNSIPYESADDYLDANSIKTSELSRKIAEVYAVHFFDKLGNDYLTFNSKLYHSIIDWFELLISWIPLNDLNQMLASTCVLHLYSNRNAAKKYLNANQNILNSHHLLNDD